MQASWQYGNFHILDQKSVFEAEGLRFNSGLSAVVPGLAESLGCGLGCHKRRTPVKQDGYPHLCAGNASSCAHLLAASPGLKGQNAGWGTLSACKTLRLFFSCDTRSTFPEFEFKNWIESHVLYSLKWQTEPVYRLCTALFNFLFPFQLVPIFTLRYLYHRGISRYGCKGHILQRKYFQELCFQYFYHVSLQQPGW